MAIIEDLGIEELTAGQQIVFAHTANNVSGVLAVACGSSDTTIVLSPGGGALFPNAPFYCSIEFEVLWCLSKSGDSFIVQRGMDGTAATTHAVGNSVEMRNNAGLWTDAYNAINAVSTDVGNLATGITNKTALPPDTTFAGNTQELTHKTIDLTDAAKANVIIGTVQPDPASLPLQNILVNGGFEEWSYTPTQTLAAGTPTSGGRSVWFANGWNVVGVNDSAITVTKDSSNPDPLLPSGVDTLINVSTVQGADWCYIQQGFDGTGSNQAVAMSVDLSDIKKLVGVAVSLSARIKLISGNVLVRFVWQYFDVSFHTITGPSIALSGANYNTYKFENQIPVANAAANAFFLSIQFQGVGQLAIDNVMANVGNTAVGYRARPAIRPTGPNLLTNGGFEIWQRGAGPFGVGAGITCDKWLTTLHSGESVTQETSLIDTGSTVSMKVSTSSSSAPGSPTQIWNQKVLENTQRVRQKTFSFSARVLINVPNMVRLCIWDGFTAIYSPYHPGDSSWRTLSVTATMSSTANTLDVCFNIEAAGTCYLDNAMVVFGAIPADYVPLTYADDLARCQRYYEIIGKPEGAIQVGAYALAANGTAFFTSYKTMKSVGPTVTKNGTWATNNSSQPAIVSATGMALDGISFQWTAIATGYCGVGNNSAGQFISSEAN